MFIAERYDFVLCVLLSLKHLDAGTNFLNTHNYLCPETMNFGSDLNRSSGTILISWTEGMAEGPEAEDGTVLVKPYRSFSQPAVLSCASPL